MDIYLVRHGLQVAKEMDCNEPLSDQGREHAQIMAKLLKKEGVLIETIVSSPKLRAKQTAEIFAYALDYSKEEIVEDARLTPLAPVEDSIDCISAMGDTLLIVGHLPSLQCIASFLLSSSSSIHLDFQTASCAKITVNNLSDRNATLVWLFSPQFFE